MQQIQYAFPPAGTSEHSSTHKYNEHHLVRMTSIDPFPSYINFNDADQFQPIKYITNYVPVLEPDCKNDTADGDNDGCDAQTQIRVDNERILKNYYDLKRPLNNGSVTSGSTTRHESVVSNSNSDTTANTLQQPNERSKASYCLDNFIANCSLKIDPYDFKTKFSRKSNADDNEDGEQDAQDRRHITYNQYVKTPYAKYFQKLLTTEVRDIRVLQRHCLWTPVLNEKLNKYLVNPEEPIPHDVLPIFIGGLDYIPRAYDHYQGSSLIPGLFSAYKLPALTYHCSLEFNGQIYILGGLMACQRNDLEAPNLEDFYVEPLKNLPPPLLSEIITNPSMVNNPHLYVTSVSACHLTRPEISGHIPPTLLCSTASKLTDRHIFFYGGFELKTESFVSSQGNYYLKKRLFLNNCGYVLDLSLIHI